MGCFKRILSLVFFDGFVLFYTYRSGFSCRHKTYQGIGKYIGKEYRYRASIGNFNFKKLLGDRVYTLKQFTIDEAKRIQKQHKTLKLEIWGRWLLRDKKCQR